MACTLSGVVDTTRFGSRIADGLRARAFLGVVDATHPGCHFADSPRTCTFLGVVDESGGLERKIGAVLFEIGSYGRARNDKT